MNRYEELAQAGGFTVCQEKHTNGHTSGAIHVPRERFTERGAFTLLMQAADGKIVWHAERWRWRYHRALWVTETARQAKVRLSRTVWQQERALLREELSEYAARVPSYARPDEYDKAVRWAARA